MKERKTEKGWKYLNLCIGDMLGKYSQYSALCRYGIDGVIQICFGCMREIVAESIIPSISRDYKIPTMTLTVDELTGEWLSYKIEAFVDLWNRRKE